MSLKADVRAELEALKEDVQGVDQCLHADLFALEARISKLEDEAEAKAKAAVAAVESEVKKI